MKIKIGTRGSKLALWQANYIATLIGQEKTEIKIIKTEGDQIKNVSFNKMEGKGFFTKEIELALLERKIDLAVHSLKDLPTDSPAELKLAVIPKRESPADILIYRAEKAAKNYPLPLKKGAVIGTSSIRRLSQLKNIDSTLKIEPLRGNINTRLKKIEDGFFDGIILAEAGLKRLDLNLGSLLKYVFSYDLFLPAPGQGALGLQIREEDDQLYEKIKGLNHLPTEKEAKAERSFLHNFGGGCHLPLGALALYRNNKIFLEGLVVSPETGQVFRAKEEGKDPKELGARLAQILKKQGAKAIL
jgi:hydroxymethylbilane synthase